MKRRVDIPIAMMGLAFWWPFLRNSITGFVLTVPSDDVLLRQSAFCVFMAVAAVACVAGSLLCLRRGGRPRAARLAGAFPGAVVGVGVAASATSLLAIVVPDGGRLAAQVVCAIVMAGAYVLLPLAWGAYLTGCVRDVRGILLLALSSYALSFVVGYLSYLPEPFTYVRPVGAPAISGAAWYACHTLARRPSVACGSPACGGAGVSAHAADAVVGREARTAVAEGAGGAGGRGAGPARILYGLALVFFLVSSVATGFINTGSVAYVPSENTLVRDTLSLVLTIFLLAAVVVTARSGREVPLAKLQFLLIALLGVVLFGGIFIATFMGSDLFAWGTGLMQASKSCFSLVIFELVLLAANRSRSLPAIARSMPLFVLPTLASSCISYVVVPVVVEVFGITYEGFWGTLSLTMGFALGVFLFVYLSSLAIRGVPAAGAVASGASGAAGRDPVLAAGASHDLTAREREILALLVKGNTYRKIAELLGVSENTVQYHSKNIYRKFDVHTKQQLIDCVGRYED